MEETSKDPSRYPPSWLPYAVGAIGILASFLLWFSFTYEAAKPIVVELHNYITFIVLALGASLSILCAIAVRLIQVTHERSRLLAQVNQDFQNEIAERLRTEETKQQLEKALLQGQKLQAIGTLAGGIAHDFNNILYAVTGYVEMAREDTKQDTLIHKNLGKVLEASHRGQELVSRILAFSRRQHHDLKPIELEKTIENALSLLKPTIPASITIDFKCPQGDCMILGDQTQLHQVIVNIINNAVDAMDGEGPIKLILTHVPSNDDILKQFPAVKGTSYCRIDIIDAGYGMDQNTMQRIFEPFFTTKEVGKGTGLGLSTVHAIIKEHQGEVMVNSQLGHGTTFTLLLPVYVQEK